MKCFKSILGCLLIFFSVNCSAQLTPNELLEDLAQLKELIESRHVRPYRLVSKEALQKISNNAKANIKSRRTCDESCYVELLKVVAALRDGHSMVRSGSREKLFGYLPFTVTWFKEGLFLTRTTEGHADLLGARLVGINDVPIEEVLQAIKKYFHTGMTPGSKSLPTPISGYRAYYTDSASVMIPKKLNYVLLKKARKH